MVIIIISTSLSETMNSFIDEQVESKGYSSSSEYMRDLIQREQDHQNLRHLLLDGAASPKTPYVEDAFFGELHD